MGNQLTVSGAAATVNLADVSSSLELKAPLSRRGRLFTTLHCVKRSTEMPSSSSSYAGSQQRSSPQHSTPQSQDIVAKIFVRNPEDRTQAAIIAQHHHLLLAMDTQLREVCVTPYFLEIPVEDCPPAAPLPPGSAALTGPSAGGKTTILQRQRAAAVALQRAPPLAVPCHILFYTEMDPSDRFCKLTRPFVQYSLADRLQMRPFWSMEQRLFACYQLLEALAQLHDVFGTVHGDLKLENCLITSSGWLYLVDMAPFKPTYLPVFNPANFEFYYDNSETRTCCSAPEKFFEAKVPVATAVASPPIAPQPAAPTLGATFVEVASIGNIQQRSSSPIQPHAKGGPLPTPIGPLQELQHTKAMDVFSAGCVMAHIMTDEPLFKLPDVLKLRSLLPFEKEGFVSSLLASRGISADSPLSKMLQSILCSPPDSRPTARQLLRSSSVFPSFFAFLHNNVLPQVLRQPPDGAMHLLWSRVDDIFHAVRHCVSEESLGIDEDGLLPSGRSSVASQIGRLSHTVTAAVASSSSNRSDVNKDDSVSLLSLAHPSIQKALTVVSSVLLPLLLSMGRHVRTADATSKLLALIRKLTPHATSSAQRDLILPLVLHFLRSRDRALLLYSSSKSSAPPPRRPAGTSSGLRFPSIVCASALYALHDVCAHVERHFTVSEGFIFDDYIYPVVVDMARHLHDTPPLVQSAFAEVLPSITLGALKFLEIRQAMLTSQKGIVFTTVSYDTQRQTIVNFAWETFRQIFKLRHCHVVLTALQKVPQLAFILGEEKVIDDLIPLLTTMLTEELEVRRMVLRYATRIHADLVSLKGLKTLEFFVDVGLRETDITCLVETLNGLYHVLEKQKTMLVTCTARVMALVQRCVPLIAYSIAVVADAARRIVELTAAASRPSDLLMYLERDIRPFLAHPVPLTMLRSFPHEIKSELTFSNPGGLNDNVQERREMSSRSLVTQQICAKPDCVTISSSGRRSIGDIPNDVRPIEVTTFVAPSLATTNPHPSTEPDAVFGMSLRPTERQERRLDHRRDWKQVCDEQKQARAAAVSNHNNAVGGSSTKGGSGGVSTGAAAAALHAASGSLRCCAAPALTATIVGSPLYDMCSIGGSLITAGGNRSLKVWDVSTDDYRIVDRLSEPTEAILLVEDETLDRYAPHPKTTFLSCSTLGGEGGARPHHVVTTSSDGWLSVVDLHAQRVTSSQSISHRTLSDAMGPYAPSGTCLAVVGANLVVVGTSSGVAHLVDLRVPMKAASLSLSSTDQPLGVLVWSVQGQGALTTAEPITAVTTLWQPPSTATAAATLQVGHEFLTATIEGHVVVHDIRFRTAVQCHTLQGTRGERRPCILSMCNEATGGGAAGSSSTPPSSQGRSNTGSQQQQQQQQPSVYVGTHTGEVRCLNLATGAETQVMRCSNSSTAATSASSSSSRQHNDPNAAQRDGNPYDAPLAIRCLVKPSRTPLVVSAGNDSVIRLWNTVNPAASHRLCISLNDSPRFYQSAGVVEEGAIPAAPSRGLSELNRGPTAEGNRVFGVPGKPHHEDAITSLHILTLQGGQYLASGSRDGALTVWHNAPTNTSTSIPLL